MPSLSSSQRSQRARSGPDRSRAALRRVLVIHERLGMSRSADAIARSRELEASHYRIKHTAKDFLILRLNKNINQEPSWARIRLDGRSLFPRHRG